MSAAEDKPAAEEAAADVDVLFPDIKVEVRDPDGGEAVEVDVREFRMLDGLRAQAEARELIVEVARVAAEGDGTEGGAVALEAAIGGRADEWLALLARATGRDAEWLGRLSDRDGQALNVAMWEANGPFFVRRIVAAIRDGSKTGDLFASLGSLATSSPQATGETSGTSPDGSRSGKSS